MKRSSPLQKLYLGIILLIMYIPIIIVIIYSFNESRLTSVWAGFTWRWYIELFRDRAMFSALVNSVILATSASTLAAVIGTFGAVGMVWDKPVYINGRMLKTSRFSGIMEYLSILPIMTPEIILGMVLLVFFAFIRLPLGMLTLILAHTSFCIPYVYLLVKARLAGVDRSYIDAARNLGASPWQAFIDVLFPLILPAIISGMLLSFAMSFDDVIISIFVTGPHTNTLPIRIFTQLRTGVTPKTNAMCTLLFLITIFLVLLSFAISRIKLPGGAPEKNTV